MTADLITLFQAGTYKINYGVETVSPRLQETIGKRLDVPRALAMIDRTSRAGIITGAYFMLGFPTQTEREIMETIEYAATSRLDVAYFFKATPYPGSALHHDAAGEASGAMGGDYRDLHFYAAHLSAGGMDARTLNRLILRAQRRFYLSVRRLWRGFWNAPHKGAYLRHVIALCAVLLQARMVEDLAAAPERTSE